MVRPLVPSRPCARLRRPVYRGWFVRIETGRGVDVRGWLQGLGLETYAEAFADNDIDGAMLPALEAALAAE